MWHMFWKLAAYITQKKQKTKQKWENSILYKNAKDFSYCKE